MSQDMLKQLQEPFPAEDIEWRVGSTNADKTKGIALAYVTNRAIMNRLDDIFGPFGWKNEFKEWKGTSQLCGISILWNGEWITKWDGADDSQTEAVKGGLSDAMKRAGYQWGIGRYLYNLENQWVTIAPAGRSYKLAQTPTLPAWALPTGYTQEQSPVQTYAEAVAEKVTNAPEPPKEPTATPTGALATVGQAKMISVRAKEAQVSMERITDFVNYEVKKTDQILKADVNKVLKMIEEHKEKLDTMAV